jgi:hypothetical protein
MSNNFAALLELPLPKKLRAIGRSHVSVDEQTERVKRRSR